MQTPINHSPTSTPLPDAICPGCGSFRPGDQPYCESCYAGVSELWPEVKAEHVAQSRRPVTPAAEQKYLQAA